MRPALTPFSPLTPNLFSVNCTPISHPFTNCSLGSFIPHPPQNNPFHRMLILSLRISPQGLLTFVLLTLLLGESPLSPKLVLRDCCCHSPTPFLRDLHPSKLPLRECFLHSLSPSLLLRESLPFPCSSEIAPFTPGICCHPPQGCPLIPKTAPEGLLLLPPLHVLLMEMLPYPENCPSGLAPHHLQSSSGITPSRIIPLLPLRDHSLIPKTIPQGLTLSSSRVAPIVS